MHTEKSTDFDSEEVLLVQWVSSKMVIHIRLLGPYAKFGSRLEKGTLSLKKGARVKDVVDALQMPSQNIQLILVNGRSSNLSAELSEGDSVKFFPTMGGG